MRCREKGGGGRKRRKKEGRKGGRELGRKGEESWVGRGGAYMMPSSCGSGKEGILLRRRAAFPLSRRIASF